MAGEALVCPCISANARSDKLSGSLTHLLDGSQVANLFNTKFSLYFNGFALLHRQIHHCLKDNFQPNPRSGQVLHHRVNCLSSNIRKLLQLQAVTSTFPTFPGKDCFRKPCTNLFLRNVHRLLSDKLLLFCCEPCSKQGQEPLVSLALSLPKELCACRKDSHVSSAPGMHSA